jgi:hypothetical protein
VPHALHAGARTGWCGSGFASGAGPVPRMAAQRLPRRAKLPVVPHARGRVGADLLGARRTARQPAKPPSGATFHAADVESPRRARGGSASQEPALGLPRSPAQADTPSITRATRIDRTPELMSPTQPDRAVADRLSLPAPAARHRSRRRPNGVRVRRGIGEGMIRQHNDADPLRIRPVTGNPAAGLADLLNDMPIPRGA